MLDGSQEIVVVNRFGKKIHRSFFHGTYPHGYITVTCEENNGNGRDESFEFLLQINPAQSGHLNIQDDATGETLLGHKIEKLAGRRKRFHYISPGPQQTLQSLAHSRIV